MPILFQYLLKLSVSLGIMYLFYQFVLRRLTFYNHNRWYLTGYSLLCFFISFINISPILEKNKVVSHEIVAFIPAVEMLTTKVSPDPAFAMGLGHWTIWSWLLLFLIAGTGILFLRFAFQLISFKKLTGKARLIADNEIKFYQVNENIIPFSFGNSIFINQHLHTETELKEIIRHEFVHVKQRHTVDIIWSEILCILNWYNPFAWLIRKSIRQNLEFIADNKVLENGMDKKQYQYLLLKVIGNNHFSIASNFNFSSLKKRIAMMNKIRSAKLHLIKFLFVLPLIAVLLLAFRGGSDGLHRLKEFSRDEFFGQNPDVKNVGWVYDNFFSNKIVQIIIIKKRGNNEVYNVNDKSSMTEFEKKYGIHYNALIPDLSQAKSGFINVDTVPDIAKVNNKGYFIDIKDNKGNCMIVVKDKDKKEVKRLLLTEWNKNEKYYKELYGEILKPITITAVPVAEAIPIPQTLQPIQPSQPLPGAQPVQPLQPSQKIRPEPAVKLRNVVPDNDINKPLIIVDGVEWGQDVDVDILDANKIGKVDVIKNGSAANLYGEKGKNGVVIITTKKQGTDNSHTSAIRIRGKVGIAEHAIYYVNGKETSKEAVELIDPAKIQSINVLKGNPAKQKYGEKGKNGVVEIIMTGSANSNFIEKPITPAWDIKNFLPGKKKDEC